MNKIYTGFWDSCVSHFYTCWFTLLLNCTKQVVYLFTYKQCILCWKKKCFSHCKLTYSYNSLYFFKGYVVILKSLGKWLFSKWMMYVIIYHKLMNTENVISKWRRKTLSIRKYHETEFWFFVMIYLWNLRSGAYQSDQWSL